MLCFSVFLTLKALNSFCEIHGDQRVFYLFETIIKVFVRSFWLIWIPMLWVYSLYKYVYSYSAGIDISRQNLTSTDVRFLRLKSIPENAFLTLIANTTFKRHMWCEFYIGHQISLHLSITTWLFENSSRGVTSGHSPSIWLLYMMSDTLNLNILDTIKST